MKNLFVSVPELPAEEQQRLHELKDKLKYKIIKLNVKASQEVEFNQILATYGVYFIKTGQEIQVWKDKIRAMKHGKIKRISVSEQSKVRPGQSLMVIEYCPHEMEFNGLCALCGADITHIQKQIEQQQHIHAHTTNSHHANAGSTSSSTPHPHQNLPGGLVGADHIKASHVMFGNQASQRKILRLTSSALEKMRSENTEHLLSNRKLALVLDIDHTFLHATRDPQAKLVAKHYQFKESTHSFTLPGHRYPYYIKIRPGFRAFLLDVAAAFDIHLYTMSMRKYAEEIVKWIENPPHSSTLSDKQNYKSLIQNLVARDDVQSNKKLLHRLFPCDERMVIIIDDRIDVWPNATQNVIQIHKYLFWPNTEEEGLAPHGQNMQLGSTQIILEKKIKSKYKLEIEKGLKCFISNFFKELGCYKIDVLPEIIYIFTHKSPDDSKLHRFSMAIKEALDLEVKNSQSNLNEYDDSEDDYVLEEEDEEEPSEMSSNHSTPLMFALDGMDGQQSRRSTKTVTGTKSPTLSNTGNRQKSRKQKTKRKRAYRLSTPPFYCNLSKCRKKLTEVNLMLNDAHALNQIGVTRMKSLKYVMLHYSSAAHNRYLSFADFCFVHLSEYHKWNVQYTRDLDIILTDSLHDGWRYAVNLNNKSQISSFFEHIFNRQEEQILKEQLLLLSHRSTIKNDAFMQKLSKCSDFFGGAVSEI